MRKVRELVVTQWLEHDLTKARILALYLNVIEWGDGIYGCEAAARAWYGKSASALDETEAAGLAAMIPNPRRINPRVSKERHQRATRRVLWLMALAGYVGRDVAGLGTEPPAEPVPEDEAGETSAADVPEPGVDMPAPDGAPTEAPTAVPPEPTPPEPSPSPTPPPP